MRNFIFDRYKLSMILEIHQKVFFFLCAIQFPEQQSLFTIFSAFLNKHFSKYKNSMQEQVAVMIKTALSLHSEVERSF